MAAGAYLQRDGGYLQNTDISQSETDISQSETDISQYDKLTFLSLELAFLSLEQTDLPGVYGRDQLGELLLDVEHLRPSSTPTTLSCSTLDTLSTPTTFN